LHSAARPRACVRACVRAAGVCHGVFVRTDWRAGWLAGGRARPDMERAQCLPPVDPLGDGPARRGVESAAAGGRRGRGIVRNRPFKQSLWPVRKRRGELEYFNMQLFHDQAHFHLFVFLIQNARLQLPSLSRLEKYNVPWNQMLVILKQPWVKHFTISSCLSSDEAGQLKMPTLLRLAMHFFVFLERSIHPTFCLVCFWLGLVLCFLECFLSPRCLDQYFAL
jgi:hypothetical protein